MGLFVCLLVGFFCGVVFLCFVLSSNVRNLLGTLDFLCFFASEYCNAEELMFLTESLYFEQFL